MTAKCSDQFAASLMGRWGGSTDMIGEEYVGYVPDFMPGSHYGDYVDLEINVDTGMIENWVKPSDAELKKVFKHLNK